MGTLERKRSSRAVPSAKAGVLRIPGCCRAGFGQGKYLQLCTRNDRRRIMGGGIDQDCYPDSLNFLTAQVFVTLPLPDADRRLLMFHLAFFLRPHIAPVGARFPSVMFPVLSTITIGFKIDRIKLQVHHILQCPVRIENSKPLRPDA